MDAKSVFKIQNEYVRVDPQLLFQGFMTVGRETGEQQTVMSFVTSSQFGLRQNNHKIQFAIFSVVFWNCKLFLDIWNSVIMS